MKAAAVESAQEALGQSSPPNRTPIRKKKTSRRGPGRPRKAAKRKTGGRIRRSAENLEKLGDTILGYVKLNQGMRLEQIAKDLNLSTAEMKRPVALLLEAKKLSTKGQRRGTTYYAGRGGSARKTKKKATRKRAKQR